MKLGNIYVFANGHIIIPPEYTRALFSLSILVLPLLLEIPFFVMASTPVLASFSVIHIVILAFPVSFLFVTTLRDPGIIPGHELEELQINELKYLLNEKQQLFEAETTKNNLTEPTVTQINSISLEIPTKQAFPQILAERTPFYVNFAQTHNPLTPLKIEERDFTFTLKYCQTCRFYRPLRASHSSKSDVCIQRYDHFCAWIGGDVGLRNLPFFYLLVLSVVVLLAFCEVEVVYALVYCGVFHKRNVIAFAFSIILELAQAGLAGYMLFSTLQLLAYHRYLLLTGALTKEDSGPDNAIIAGPFSRFGVIENLRLSFQGASAESILQKELLSYCYIKRLVASNPYVTSWDSLGRVLCMNGYEQFREAQCSNGASTQQINEKVQYSGIFSVKDGAEYAIMQSKYMVITSKAVIESLRVTRPELFVQKINRESLAMAQLGKKQEGAKDSSAGKQQSIQQVQVAGI